MVVGPSRAEFLENLGLGRYPKLVKNGKNGKNGRNFGGFFREKIVRGVGSSHRKCREFLKNSSIGIRVCGPCPLRC